MLTTRIIPCLDVSEGRVVKGVQFENLRDMGSPPELAKRYQDEGADEIVFLDIVATEKGRRAALDCVEKVRRVLSIPLTVGGGIRAVADADAFLQAGADRVSVNTAAFLNPNLIAQLAQKFGRQCVVVAVDAAATQVVTHAGTRFTGRDVVGWCKEVEKLGAGEILLTSRDSDGTKRGYNTKLLAEVTAALGIPVVASGGAFAFSDFDAALRAGAAALLAASVFHEELFTVGELKQYLAQQGWEMRL